MADHLRYTWLDDPDFYEGSLASWNESFEGLDTLKHPCMPSSDEDDQGEEQAGALAGDPIGGSAYEVEQRGTSRSDEGRGRRVVEGGGVAHAGGAVAPVQSTSKVPYTAQAPTKLPQARPIVTRLPTPPPYQSPTKPLLRPSPSPPAKRPTIILSSDSEIEEVSYIPPPVPSKRPRKSTSSPPTSVVSPKKGAKGRPSAPATLDRFFDSLPRNHELIRVYPTLTRFLAAWSSIPYPLPAPSKPQFWQGCRIAFVNTSKSKVRDPNDQMITRFMRSIIQHGGVIVDAMDFKAAPVRVEASHRDAVSDEQWAKRGKKEGWTTHIVAFQVDRHEPEMAFERLLKLVGKEGGVKIEELEGTHVVGDKWLSDCLKVQAKVTEVLYARRSERVEMELEGDMIDRGENCEEEERVVHSSGEEDEDHEDEQTSITADDWVLGECPPPNYFTKHRDEPTWIAPTDAMDEDYDETTLDSDPIIDLPLTASTSESARRQSGSDDFADLRQQLDQVEKADRDFVCDPAQDQFPEDFIFNSDIESDDGYNTDDEKHGVAVRGVPEAIVTGPKGYACEWSSTGESKVQEKPNAHIADVIEHIGKLIVPVVDKDRWRKRGYEKAANSLRGLTTPYHPHQKYKDIGSRMATKIVEIIKTGTHRRIKFSSQKDTAVKTFCGVYGIGSIRASQLWDQGYKTLEDLKSWPSLTEGQKLGIQYYDDLAKRIPRSEVEEMYQFALDAAKWIDPKLQVLCMGSYRRGQPDCGDIDLLVTRDPSDGIDHKRMIERMWSMMMAQGFCRHLLSTSNEGKGLEYKINGLCALPNGLMRRIDVLGVPFDELPAALTYFTGNDFFNRSLRLKAGHMGMRLNQRGLYKNIVHGPGRKKLNDGIRVDCKTEEEIFTHLGVTWRPPNERNP